MKNHRKREKCCVAYPLSLNCIQVKFFDCIQDCEGLDWMHNCTIRAGFATKYKFVNTQTYLGGWFGWMDLSQNTVTPKKMFQMIKFYLEKITLKEHSIIITS